jgi:hypothetical protein
MTGNGAVRADHPDQLAQRGRRVGYVAQNVSASNVASANGNRSA